MAHEHDAADHFVAVLFEDAAAEAGAELHGGHGLHVDWHAVHFADEGVLDVGFVANPADPANDVLGVVLLNHAAGRRQVRTAHGVEEFADAHAVSAEVFRPHVHLILHRHPADRRDLGDAARRSELRRDVELVQRPEFLRVDWMLRVRFDRVPEDLPESRGVRREVRSDALGEVIARFREPFAHPLPREVEVDVVLEDHGDHREVELARRPHHPHSGKPLELARKRVRNLILDLARAATGPVGEDDHLVLAQVRHGIDRRVEHGVDAERGQRRRHDEDDEPIANGHLDDACDHGLPSGRIGGSFLNSSTRLSTPSASFAALSMQPLQQT